MKVSSRSRSVVPPSPSLLRHQRRLRAAFQPLLLLGLGASASLQACGQQGSLVGGGDASAPDDATTDAGGDAADETATTLDATTDGGHHDAAADATTDARASDSATASDAGDGGSGDADDGAVLPMCEASAPYFRPDDSGARPCFYYVDYSCAPYQRFNGSCTISGNDCLGTCTLDGGFFGCEYAYPTCALNGQWLAEAGQPITVGCELCLGAGRRPAGLRKPRAPRTTTALGRHFARVAHVEAASVHAFERLAVELSAHGAPAALVAAARRSARDETRHARATARLAGRHGARVPGATVRRGGVRSLERVARENAVEGCVHETVGALWTAWQATHASDPEVRATMTRIAADEMRHAALAWAVAEWAHASLDDAGRTRVERARARAIARLRDAPGDAPDPNVARAVGLPSPREASALLSRLTEGLWRAA